jgi:hypothetical protein
MTGLVLLALALSFGAAYRLRRNAPSVAATLGALAAATILAGIAYAVVAGVVVNGEQCRMRSTQTWNADEPAMLVNQCSNALLIEAIDAECPTAP